MQQYKEGKQDKFCDYQLRKRDFLRQEGGN